MGLGRRVAEAEEQEDEDYGVKVSGTDVFFYSPVNSNSVSRLNFVLRELERELSVKAIALQGYEPHITLYIKSPGGDIFEGFSAMDHITNSKLYVTTVADGVCASAGTFLLLAGDTVRMNPHAYLLIHQLSMDGVWGNFEEVKQEVQNSEKFMDTIKEIYKEKTKIPQKKLAELMTKDVYLNYDECKKYGVVV